ncbi:MAG: glycosyltransferase family 4 protein [Armatimonadaceae bacterium]
MSLTVLMTTDTVGGVWTYSLELARALVPHQVRVVLATMGAPLSAYQRAEAQAIPHLTVYSSRYKLEWMEDPWDDVDAAGNWLQAIARREKPDLVHLNGYAHGALPWQVPVVMVAHSCVLSWWRAVKDDDAPAGWSTYRERVRRGIRGADQLVTPTQAMHQALRPYYGALPPVTVIPNGRSDELYRCKSGGEKKPFVLAAGRLWDEAKNLQALGKVAPQLGAPVCVAGDAAHPVRGDFASVGKVRSLGKLSPEMLAGVMERAAVYALPARYEPFGLSVLEAALSGCALVLGDIPSLRENWRGAALFVPPEDTEALESALRFMLSNETVYRLYGAAAQERARHFRPEAMAARYENLYQKLLNKENHFLSDSPNLFKEEQIRCVS